MNDYGFWQEFGKYETLSDRAFEHYQRSLKYPAGSKQRQILRLQEGLIREQIIPILKNLIDYLNSLIRSEKENQILANLERLLELQQK